MGDWFDIHVIGMFTLLVVIGIAMALAALREAHRG